MHLHMLIHTYMYTRTHREKENNVLYILVVIYARAI